MPSVVRSLILVDSTGIPVDPIPKVLLQKALEMTVQAPQVKFTQFNQIFQAFLYNFLFKTQNTIQTLWLALEKDLRPLLPQIETPCLIVWGANYLTNRLTPGQEFLQRIRGSKLILLDNVYQEWSIFLKNLQLLYLILLMKLKRGNSEKRSTNGHMVQD